VSTNNLIQKLKIPGLPQIIPLLTVVMEICWIYSWLIWISSMPALHWSGPPLNFISCLFLGLLIEIIARQALNSRWSLKKVRWVVLPASFLLLFILVRLNLGGGYALFDYHWFNYLGRQTGRLMADCIFGILIIWRAFSAGQQDNSFSVIYQRFVVGLVFIILVLVVWRLGSNQISSIWQSIGLEILLFFGGGLLALAVANLEKLRNELAQHQEATATFSRRWISMLIILVVAILAIGVLFTGLLSADTGNAIAHFLGKLGGWLLQGFIYLLYPVGFIAQILVWVGRFLLSLIRREPPPPLDASNMGDVKDLFNETGEGSLPVALVQALKWGSIIIASGLVIFFLSRILSRYWKGKSEEGVEEVHETLGAWNLFKMDLRNFLNWLISRLRRRKATATEDELQYRSAALDSETDKQYTIREIYQALLWEGRQDGTPRRPNETPYEYYRRLKEHRENMSQELDALTEAYVIERYGQVNPAPEKVSGLNRLWRSLRDKFRNKESDL
jgi:hypothetical protein